MLGPVVSRSRTQHGADGGTEHATQDENYDLTFYGHSFIADHTGEIVQQADNHSETVLLHEFDMESIRRYRDAWGIYRDRRPDLYQAVATLDGRQQDG